MVTPRLADCNFFYVMFVIFALERTALCIVQSFRMQCSVFLVYLRDRLQFVLTSSRFIDFRVELLIYTCEKFSR
jgi:hypothetical protein